MEIKDTAGRKTKVVMLPWLAHGHISPYLELAKKLALRNFHIYFVSTPVNLASIRPKITPIHSSSVQLVDLHLPSLPDLPPSAHTTNGLPLHLMSALKRAFQMSGPAFSGILDAVGPDLLIYDFNQPWAADAALSRGVPCVQFLTVAAVFLSFGYHMFRSTDGGKYPFPEIYLRGYEIERVQNSVENSADDAKDTDRIHDAMDRSCGITLIRSFKEVEGKYIDYFSQLTKKKVVPVGPLTQEPSNGQEDNGEIMEWLDKKGEKSVVFVSFGSEYFLSQEEREELAHGLAESGINFIWVIRVPAKDHAAAPCALPEGFLERVGERGIVVEGWAPQAKILAHPSTGGFVSHCGWGSIIESMKFGVPIVAMPIHVDQPFNARLVVGVGAGVEVERDGTGKSKRGAIAGAIRKVVVEESGESVRKTARDLSEKLRTKGEEEIDGVVEELVKLLGK